MVAVFRIADRSRRFECLLEARARARRVPRGDHGLGPLDLARLEAYRLRPSGRDGLFLRFGGLPESTLHAAAAALVAAERDARR